MEEIIKKAIEGGYANDRPEYARQHLITGFEGDFRFMVIDPLFWQSLGKTCGWNDESLWRAGIDGSAEWYLRAMSFHEINLTEGWGKAIEYLNSLIK